MSQPGGLWLPGVDGIDRLSAPDVDSSFRWGTVVTVNPLTVLLDGDSAPLAASPSNLSAGQLIVGTRVWVQLYGRRTLVLGSAGYGYDASWLRMVRSPLWTGGGVITSTSAGFGWSYRFMFLGFGHGDSTTPDYLQLYMPPDGTVIPGYGGASDITVAGGQIPMPGWGVLWYVLPPAPVPLTQDDTRWAFTGYLSDFDVPANWIPVATRNFDPIGPAFKILLNGQSVDYERTPTLANGWVNYGADHAPLTYRKDDQWVTLTGVGKSGTISTSTTGNMFTLPAGYRPATRLIFTNTANGDTSIARTDVYADGSVRAYAGAGNVFWSITNIRFRAAQ